MNEQLTGADDDPTFSIQTTSANPHVFQQRKSVSSEMLAALRFLVPTRWYATFSFLCSKYALISNGARPRREDDSSSVFSAENAVSLSWWLSSCFDTATLSFVKSQSLWAFCFGRFCTCQWPTALSNRMCPGVWRSRCFDILSSSNYPRIFLGTDSPNQVAYRTWGLCLGFTLTYIPYSFCKIHRHYFKGKHLEQTANHASVKRKRWLSWRQELPGASLSCTF